MELRELMGLTELRELYLATLLRASRSNPILQSLPLLAT